MESTLATAPAAEPDPLLGQEQDCSFYLYSLSNIISFGWGELVLRKLKNGTMDPNKSDVVSPIGAAIFNNNVAILKILLEFKADPNATYPNNYSLINVCTPTTSITPLELIIARANAPAPLEMARLLVRAGARIDGKTLRDGVGECKPSLYHYLRREMHVQRARCWLMLVLNAKSVTQPLRLRLLIQLVARQVIDDSLDLAYSASEFAHQVAASTNLKKTPLWRFRLIGVHPDVK